VLSLILRVLEVGSKRRYNAKQTTTMNGGGDAYSGGDEKKESLSVTTATEEEEEGSRTTKNCVALCRCRPLLVETPVAECQGCGSHLLWEKRMTRGMVLERSKRRST